MKLTCAFAISVIMLSLSAIGTVHAVDAFQFLMTYCHKVRGDGPVLECEVFQYQRAIAITVDLDSAEASVVCNGMGILLLSNSESIDDLNDFAGWEIRIISPYSNGTPIARCRS